MAKLLVSALLVTLGSANIIAKNDMAKNFGRMIMNLGDEGRRLDHHASGGGMGDMQELMVCVAQDCTMAGMAMMNMQQLQDPAVLAQPEKVIEIMEGMCKQIESAYECMKGAESCKAVYAFVTCICEGFVMNTDKTCGGETMMYSLGTLMGAAPDMGSAAKSTDASCHMAKCILAATPCTGILDLMKEMSKAAGMEMDVKKMMDDGYKCGCGDCKAGMTDVVDKFFYKAETKCGKVEGAMCVDESADCKAEITPFFECLKCAGDTCIETALETLGGVPGSFQLLPKKEQECYIGLGEAAKCGGGDGAAAFAEVARLSFVAAALAISQLF